MNFISGFFLVSLCFIKIAHAETWVQQSSYHFGIIKSLLRSQGIANDGHGHFWFSSRQTLEKSPSATGVASKLKLFPIPKNLRKLGENHIGDIDFANGKIYAPIEDGPDYRRPFIGIFDADTLKVEKLLELPQNQQRDGVPWVAVDSYRGRAYSSEYNNTTVINVYDLETFKPIDHILMSQMVNSIQGAKVFNGNLYMTANAPEKGQFALYKMDLTTGSIEQVGKFNERLYEIEGLTFVPSANGYDLLILGVVGRGLSRRVNLFTFKIQ